MVDGVKKGTKPEDILKNIIGGRKNEQSEGEGTQNDQHVEPSNNVPVNLRKG